MGQPSLSAEEKRRHLAAAKRWSSRMKAAHGRPERMRCHDQAMRHIYLVLGHVPTGTDPGKLL